MIAVAVPAAAVAPKVRVKQIAFWVEIRGERLRARGAGLDAESSFRGLRKICYMSTGAHEPRRKGRPRKDLGNPCFLPCRAPG